MWVPPLALLALASALAGSGRIDSSEEGTLIVIGTSVFGALCLANALRCGRVHCWIDGTALPALAVVGLLELVGAYRFAWPTFLTVLWGIIVLGFVVECVVGSYWNRFRP